MKLRHFIAQIGGLAPEPPSRFLVLRAAIAVVIAACQIVHRLRYALLSGLRVEPHRRLHVLHTACAMCVTEGQRILRVGIALLGGLRVQPHRLLLVLQNSDSDVVVPAQIILAPSVALRSGLRVEPRRRFVVLRTACALVVTEGKACCASALPCSAAKVYSHTASGIFSATTSRPQRSSQAGIGRYRGPGQRTACRVAPPMPGPRLRSAFVLCLRVSMLCGHEEEETIRIGRGWRGEQQGLQHCYESGTGEDKQWRGCASRTSLTRGKTSKGEVVRREARGTVTLGWLAGCRDLVA
eukprot:CAMPEP_0179928276 /NCGR_PEP_ID=MMETSP0983-20121128/8781_1 /TAXON_ID=483367 /ORGANISM="non described non described, Strain CCMP 2436" /LENGTH=295 /DNA_ID=CAMNT_0021832069 /DNA_START=620 /DNA_END=1509 /DNA_ORIENTATION=+